MSTNHIQYHYLGDPRDQRRVLILATRKKAENEFEVSYAVNRVQGRYLKISSETVEGSKIISEVTSTTYEPFDKKSGRHLAEVRLTCGAPDFVRTINIEGLGSVVQKAILRGLAGDHSLPHVVRRISSARLDASADTSFSVVDGRGFD